MKLVAGAIVFLALAIVVAAVIIRTRPADQTTNYTPSCTTYACP